MKHVYRISLLAALALSAAGCSKTDTAQARSREGSAKAIQTEAVRQDTVRRAVDVVGTLAAVDEVTISSEADGKVSRILADLGDKVTAGQLLIQLDNEKQQYTYAQQQAALARTLAQYGAPDPEHLPELEDTPDARRANADLVQATQAYDRAERALQAHAHLAAGAGRRQGGAAVEAGDLQLGVAEREESPRRDPGVGSDDEARGAAASRYGDSRAVRRVRAEAAGQSRRAGQDADAGDGGRSSQPAEGHG